MWWRFILNLLLGGTSLAMAQPAYRNCGATLAYLSAHRDPRTRIVVVGTGAITPVGNTAMETYSNVIAGRSGVRRATSFDPTGQAVQIAAEIPDFIFPSNYGFPIKTAPGSRAALLSVVAAVQAAIAAQILETSPDKPFWKTLYTLREAGVYMGSTHGDISGVENAIRNNLPDAEMNPNLAPQSMAGLVASLPSNALRAAGPVSCHSAACASGSQAIAEARLALLSRPRLRWMIAGGADSHISEINIRMRNNYNSVLSRRNADPAGASRPFDVERDGFVLGEGAASLVLTTEATALEHGLPVLAYLAGTSFNGDIGNVGTPYIDGQVYTIQEALEMAGITPEQIGYIHAHGTSTKVGDTIELASLLKALGPAVLRIPISSTKSHMGHLLGASGAVGAIMAILAMNHGRLPANLNLNTVGNGGGKNPPLTDAEMNAFTLLREPLDADIEAVLVNSFGFGPQNSTLIFVRPLRRP